MLEWLWNDCGRLCLLVPGDIVEIGVIVRVRGCRVNHKKSIPFSWTKKRLIKFIEVDLVEERGQEEEGVVLSEVVLWGDRQ